MNTINSSTSINEAPTEVKLSKFIEEEEGDMIVMEICDEFLKNVMDALEAKYLESQARQFVVECAIEAMKKAVELNCYFHNISYSSMQKGSWDPDIPCEPSNADNWAAYRVPLKYSTDISEETERKTESDEKEYLRPIYETSAGKLTPSSSSQSQDVSITDILQDLSSSDDEIHHPSWDNLNVQEQEGKDDMNEEEGEGLTAKTSPFSFKSMASDDTPKKLDVHRETYNGSSKFSKTAVGEYEIGLCVPHVGNVPVTNVVREMPGVEPYILTKRERRIIRVTRSKMKGLPRRRSDTKLKISEVEEEVPKERRKLY